MPSIGRFKRPILLSAILFFLSMTSAAEVYRWVDEQGQVHFSDSKPINNATVKSIKLRAPQLIGTSTDKQAKPKQAATEAELQGKAEQLQKADANNESEKLCATIASNLEKANQTGRVRVKENGEYRYLSSQELDAKRLELQSQFDQFCSKNP